MISSCDRKPRDKWRHFAFKFHPSLPYLNSQHADSAVEQRKCQDLSWQVSSAGIAVRAVSGRGLPFYGGKRQVQKTETRSAAEAVCFLLHWRAGYLG